MKKYYTVETIKDVYNNLTNRQKAYIKNIISKVEENDVDDDKVIQDLVSYVRDISNIEMTDEPYEDILDIVY
nr:MAG TPA: membrane protein [Caudoviricetes sp.]